MEKKELDPQKAGQTTVSQTDSALEEFKQFDADEILKKFDSEADKNQLVGFMKKVAWTISICFTLFQLYTSFFGVLDAHLQRAVHLSFGMCLIFMLYPTKKSWRRDTVHPFDLLLAVLGAACPMYVVVAYADLVARAGTASAMDVAVGTLGTLLVLEGCRRVVGKPMVIVATAFILYSFAGPYLPDVLAHRGVDVEDLVQHLYFTTEGIFGIPLGVSATFIFLFILFGAYLEATGLGKFFIDIANAMAGWASGGPAKVTVLASGMMGMVSGSSVANVVGVGSFTIPMMKKLGYNKEFAGGVEAAGSTGGQIMPPVMGAAAFLMAEFIGVPYIEVVKSAVVPALLYYTGIWIAVHLEAKRKGLRGIPRNELPRVKDIFIERGHLALPLITIIYLLVEGQTPTKAALWAIVIAIAACMLKKSTRMSFRQIIDGLENGAKGVVGVMVACATAGIIIGVVTKTGVGLKLAGGLLDLAGGMLLPAMFFTMITSLILGMGVPTTANYVITSTIAAPALMQMTVNGVPVSIMAAHLFVFYFGIIADITPPVALAAYAASGISGGNPMKTGVVASKLAVAAFVVPYVFVMSPSLLMINVTFTEVLINSTAAIIGMWGLGVAMIGHWLTGVPLILRFVSFGAGLLLIDPGLLTDSIGLAILVMIYLFQRYKLAKEQKAKLG